MRGLCLWGATPQTPTVRASCEPAWMVWAWTSVWALCALWCGVCFALRWWGWNLALPRFALSFREPHFRRADPPFSPASPPTPGPGVPVPDLGVGRWRRRSLRYPTRPSDGLKPRASVPNPRIVNTRRAAGASPSRGFHVPNPGASVPDWRIRLPTWRTCVSDLGSFRFRAVAPRFCRASRAFPIVKLPFPARARVARARRASPPFPRGELPAPVARVLRSRQASCPRPSCKSSVPVRRVARSPARVTRSVARVLRSPRANCPLPSREVLRSRRVSSTRWGRGRRSEAVSPP